VRMTDDYSVALLVMGCLAIAGSLLMFTPKARQR